MDHVNLPIQPPRLFLLTLLVGLVLPDPFALPDLLRDSGWAWLLAGALLARWSFRTLKHHHTSGNPRTASVVLVTRGPYRWSRNPIYVAMLMLYSGAALVMGSSSALLLAPVLVWLVDWQIIRREEVYLAQRFREQWQPWALQTRRWF